MHVTEHVRCRGHRIVDADTARHRHARDGDRRRLRPVIDGRDQSRAEQRRLRLRRQLAAQHQPDHLREVEQHR